MTRCGWPLQLTHLAALVLLLPLLPLAANAQGLAAYVPRLEIETVSPAWQPRSAGVAAEGALPANLSQATRESVRARWWWGSGRLEVGAGADWSTLVVPERSVVDRRSATPVLGLRAELARGAHLAYERDAVVATAQHHFPAAAGGSRLALELSAGAASRPRVLPAGLLRVQLSSASTLQFRPRSGGLSVMYRAGF